MKQLTDIDIEQMGNQVFVPESDEKNRVRKQLYLSTRMPEPAPQPQKYAKLDLHNLTEEQAWSAIMELAKSGTRDATIITGASGILKIKFQQWARDSLLTPYIISVKPVNNGSFDVKFKKNINLLG